MNTETGHIYRGDEVEAALGRGEPVVPVSERVARFMELGQQAEAERQRIPAMTRGQARAA